MGNLAFCNPRSIPRQPSEDLVTPTSNAMVQNSLPSAFSIDRKCANGIQQVANIAPSYKWNANVFTATTRCELKEQVEWCKKNGVSLRVKASGWSCNRFLDPSKSDDDDQIGVQIILTGEFDQVMRVDDPAMTVTTGAATQRQTIYTELDKSGRQLMCSGECFTFNQSQEVGGLIANAVHDTMQESFSPETVHSLEALVFDEDRNIFFKSFSSSDGDDYFAFFGGMGMTGIIVSATLKCIDKKYYHYRPYLPGSKYDDDKSFDVGKNALDLDQLIGNNDIKSQHGGKLTGSYLNIEKNSGNPFYRSTFSNALKDLCLKHRCDKDDVCSVFWMFPTLDDVKKSPKGKLADGTIDVYGKPRYWKRSYEQHPKYTVGQDIFNDFSAVLGKEYRQDPRTIGALRSVVEDVQLNVIETKWKYANLMNHTTKDSERKEIQDALSNRHWAYCQSGVAHTTGPNYVFLWDKATEFYIEEKDIDVFVQILQPAVSAMMKAAGESVAFADCRYALASENAFMSGWYKKNHLAVDIGCVKYQFTNDQFTDMTTKVLLGCKAQGIRVRLHTGKFYLYEERFTHQMYSKAIRGRFGAVVSKYDPYGIFAPQRWRSLFTDNCNPILSSVSTK